METGDKRIVQGWLNHFGRFTKSVLYPLLQHLNIKLVQAQWPMRRYKRLRRKDDGVLVAARVIRPYLDELVGPFAVNGLDCRIADQLNGAPDEPETAIRLQALLEEQESTRWFLNWVLADAPRYRPPYQQRLWRREQHRKRKQLRSLLSLVGVPSPILHAGIYTCPSHGDYDWYRPAVGTPIPDCPTHHVRLIRT